MLGRHRNFHKLAISLQRMVIDSSFIMAIHSSLIRGPGHMIIEGRVIVQLAIKRPNKQLITKINLINKL